LLEQDNSLQTDGDGRDYKSLEKALDISANSLKINIFRYDGKRVVEAGQAPAQPFAALMKKFLGR
jgi:hypothetical protein